MSRRIAPILGDFNVQPSGRGFYYTQQRPIPVNPSNVVLVKQPDGTLAVGTRTTAIPEMAAGGKIKKTGLYKLHKGEIVIKASRVNVVKNAVKKAGLKPLAE